MPNLLYLANTAFVILVFAASINFIVDPAGVYRPDRDSATKFAATLIQAENGLWWQDESFSDRAIKMSLAKYSNQYECVVIGSSHVMQVGSARKINSLVNICSSILNLGVSGASIEDQFALAYLALKDGHPKKIVLGVDLWTFAFGKDHRWSFYSDDYLQARRNVFGGTSLITSEEPSGSLQSKLRNLLSLEYTIKSFRKAIGDFTHGSDRHLAILAPKTGESGGAHAALLRDGSLLYSGSYIEQAKGKPIALGGELYGTDGILNDPGAINAYRALLLWIKSKGVEPILLLTPYHQNVWKAANSKNTLALKATEPIVLQIASDLGIAVLGSYNPEAVGCLSTEFFDFMHPTADCLSKLEIVPYH
jgi:hypothetical protein